MAKQIGYRVVGTVKSIKGSCGVGHKVGDKIELSVHSSGGLCGFYYHDIFPKIQMFQFGGGFPEEWGNPEVMDTECPDRGNCVAMELRRVK